ADLPQGRAASVREHEHAALQFLELAQLACAAVPAWVAVLAFRDDRIGRRDPAVTELRQSVERDLDVRRREVFRDALRFAVRAPGRAGERVALAQRVEHLPADPAGRVRAERGAEVAAVALRGLHQADDAPRDQVLAVRPATAWIE